MDTAAKGISLAADIEASVEEIAVADNGEGISSELGSGRLSR